MGPFVFSKVSSPAMSQEESMVFEKAGTGESGSVKPESKASIPDEKKEVEGSGAKGKEQPADWKAQYEALRETSDKRERDYKALQGDLKKQQGLKEQLDSLRDDIGSAVDTITLIGRRTASGDQDMLNEDITKLEGRTQLKNLARTIDRDFEEALGDIKESLTVDGKLILDIETAEELQEARELFSKAREDAGRLLKGERGTDYQSGLIRSLRAITAVSRKKLRELATAELEEVKTKASSKLKSAGVNEMDIGTGSPTGDAWRALSATEKIEQGLRRKAGLD